uniref:biogenesis of lysosome-related organelles complex 1 subunit 4 isoform X1 n=1 Tax=Pristiophorus japonicus TaxID=55135 RepID=UPI00398F3BE1
MVGEGASVRLTDINQLTGRDGGMGTRSSEFWLLWEPERPSQQAGGGDRLPGGGLCGKRARGVAAAHGTLLFGVFKSWRWAGVCVCESQIQQLETSLEEMLTRVDEFCGMLDMIRNDSSQIMNENIPEIHAKADEMKQMYKKIDKLEAFVKMIGQNVCVLDDQVTHAEAELGTFPNAFRKILHSIGTPAFLNKSSFPKRQQQKFEPPVLFRTEDYFPAQNTLARE